MSDRDANDPTAIALYIPAEPDTWASRFERACTLLEGHPALPRAPLNLGYFAREDVEKEVEDRVAFLNRTLADPYRQVILSSGRSLRLARGGPPLDEGKVLIRASFGHPGQSGCDVSIDFPAVSWEVRVELLGRLGDVLQAHTGHFTPKRAALRLTDINLRGVVPEQYFGYARLQQVWQEIDAVLAEHELVIPRVKRPGAEGERQHPLQPAQLGWVNYWSPDAAAYLGFPDEQLDAELLTRSMRTETGAWLVKITPDPLDLTRADHLVTLAKMYARFPRAGIR